MPRDIAALSFPEQAEVLARRLRRLGTRQVGSKSLRSEIQGFVRRYFSKIRPNCPQAATNSPAVAAIDEDFQELLRCTQGRSRATRYVHALKSIAKSGRELEIVAIITIGTGGESGAPPERERLLLETMVKLSPSAARSFEQGLADLRSSLRASWRGPAVEFREALREVLDQLALDKDVEAQPGYRQEKDAHGPTMKQKVMFILRSRRASHAQVKSLADSVTVVDEKVGGFVREQPGRSFTE